MPVERAAINTPGRVLQTPCNDAGAFRTLGARRDIGLANRKVETMVVRDERLACRERNPSKGEDQRRDLARPERLTQRQCRGHDPDHGRRHGADRRH
jgi:hypothetical protein